MLWIRLRFLAVAAVSVGIASGGASVYVLGSQEPASKDGPPVAKRTATARSTRQPLTDPPWTRLRAQQLATRRADAAYEIARANRKLAEIAVEEYKDLIYPRDLELVDGEVKLAESDLRRLEDRTDWARRMFDKGYVSRATKTSEELNFKKAQFSLEQAQSKKKVLTQYTREKTIKELESEVKKARTDELAKQDAVDREKIREKEFEHQLHPGTD